MRSLFFNTLENLFPSFFKAITNRSVDFGSVLLVLGKAKEHSLSSVYLLKFFPRTFVLFTTLHAEKWSSLPVAGFGRVSTVTTTIAFVSFERDLSMNTDS